jgi:hypothetical protein
VNREELFQAWAPESSPWSTWAKPVLFAHVDPEGVAPEPLAAWEDLTWLPDRPTALVVDLPGAEAVRLGVTLAAHGWQPVPLFNGVPGPFAVVTLGELEGAVVSGAERLAGAALPAEAPPAFLLDARRMAVGIDPAPGLFDNRWLAFPQDFPSARFLVSRGITAAMLVSETGKVADDLAHVLLRWQRGGVALSSKRNDQPGPAAQLKVRQPRGFRSMLHRVLAIVGLRRNAAGGFGAIVPTPSSGGGFG